MTRRFRASFRTSHRALACGLLCCFAAIFACLPGGAKAQSNSSLMMLEWTGKYGELEKAAEARLANAAERQTAYLGPLCAAYSHLKKYGQLFSCIDELQARIGKGDTKIKADLFLAASSDAEPLPHTLRAQAYLELADFRKTVSEARAAMALITNAVMNERGGEIWGATRYRLVNLSNIALASALLGDTATTSAAIKDLQGLTIGGLGNVALYNAIRYFGIGRAYVAMGNYDGAIEAFKPSGHYTFSKAMGGLFSSDSYFTRIDLPRNLMLAKAFAEKGELGTARKQLDDIIANPRLADQADIHAIALYERGRMAERDKDPARAIDMYKRSVELIELQRSTIQTEASKIGFVGDKQAVYARLIAVLVGQARGAEAFDYVERSKSRALVDMLATRKEFAAPGVAPEKARLVLAQLDAADANARLSKDSVAEGAGTDVRNLQVAGSQVRQAAPELSTLVTVTSVPSEELKALVGANEALVEYYYQGKELYAFVLMREQFQVLKLDGDGMAEEVQALRKGIEEPGSDAWQAPASALFARLWKPVASLVGERSLIIVPHGVLHYLPFGALRKPDGGVLLQETAMRFLPSASVLKYLRPASPRSEATLLVIGNPDLGDPRMDLKFAEGEARTVAALVPGSRVLMRMDASETNFKKAGAIFSRIHFASHGKFQADDPLSSGLFLAKDGENDGLLTVGELYSMTLDADLVTLSACETGLGKIANGDDVVGLTRGFLYAGTRSIVASLWSVDDRATAELMKGFYENLAQMPKQEALRRAQLAARQSFPHPFFWAAFQLTGRAE